MDPKKEFYKNQAESIIKKMKLRKMDAYYCETVEDAKAKINELLGAEKKTVAYGGSMTINENGFREAIKAAGHEIIVREDYKTEEEVKALKAMTINADAFLMSSNAITLDGELINIDARGNRVCYMIYGPDEVYIVAGMNKIVKDVDTGIERVRNFATPPNTIRLNRDTPCSKTGKCADCYDNSICCNIVVTRLSMIPGRLKVILVGEELGY